MKPLRVLLADDRAAVRRGLRMRLELERDIAVVGEVADGCEAVTEAWRLQPDVLVMDVDMPVRNGIEAARELSSKGCPCAVVILTLYDTPALRLAAQLAGAGAFVTKQQACEELVAAIRAAAPSTEEGQEHEQERELTGSTTAARRQP